MSLTKVQSQSIDANVTISGIVTSTQLNVGTGGTIVTTTASGFVGIGTTNPSAQLHVTGQFRSTDPWDATTGGGQIYLNGTTGNRIDFNQNGVAAPAFTTRSAGTKITLYPEIGAAAADYALGIEASTLWSSVPRTSDQFKWYAGTTNIASLSGIGTFTTTGPVQGTRLISTVATGTAPLTVSSTTVVTNLNADLLDGINSGQFIRSDTNQTATASYLFQRNNPAITNGSYAQGNNHIELRTTDASNPIIGFHRSGFTATALYHSGYGVNSLRIRNADGADGPIWWSGNDGAGSGLDADLLDGVQGASFLRSNVSATNSVDLRAPIFYQSDDTNCFWDNNDFVLRGGAPTITFRDTDHNTGYIHCNSNLLYVLRGANDAAPGAWDAISGEWPFVFNLSNNDARCGRDLYAGSSMRAQIFYDSNNTGYYCDPASTSILNVVGSFGRFYTGYDSGETNSFSCSNYFRSNGNTGWYNATHNGGFFMQDSTYVRVNADKAIYTGGVIQCGNYMYAPNYYSNSTDSNPATSNISNACRVGDGFLISSRFSGVPCWLGRTDNGDLIRFHRAGVQEGQITVTSGTVTYNAFLGAHWARLEDDSKPEILVGTILESVDKLIEWKVAVFTVDEDEKIYAYHGPKSIGDTIEVEYKGNIYEAIIRNEEETTSELNKHVCVKISDTPASKKVFGVFLSWDDEIPDEDASNMINSWNDMSCASVGNYFIRIAPGQTPEDGDLIESAGNGCGKVQDDDVIRSKTVGKVTSTIKQKVYDDGSFLVTCVLYCG